MISAVWLVRSHQIAADLRYWLTYIGYDRRDHSLSHKVYLGYATVFFSAWIFATLTLLANWVGQGIKLLGAVSFSLDAETQTAAGVMALALLGWWLFRGFRAGQFSPFTFNEDDAALICQTPVSRPAVAVLWLLGDWIKIAPAFWALGVTLAFALQDRALGAAVSVEYVPRYVLAGLRLLIMVAPLHWGLMALSYAWGALRLQRARVRRFWWLGPLLLAVGLVGLLAASGLSSVLITIIELAVLKPFTFTLSAGYGLAEVGWGFLAALVWGGVGTLGLVLAARPLNLGRAAQESSLRAAVESALQAGNVAAVNEISLRRRLGMGHAPTRLAGVPGWLSLAWKTGLIWNRRGLLRLSGNLFAIFATGLGVALAPEWGSQAWAILAWLVAVEQFTVGPLVDDLQLWPLTRGLPFTARQTLLGELLLPVVFVAVIGFLSLAAAGPLRVLVPGGMSVWAAFLVPGAAFSVALAGALDVLRNCRSSRLLTGHAPMPGTTGVIIAGVMAGAAALTGQFAGGGPLGFMYAGVMFGGLGYLLLDFTADTLKRIE